MSLHPTAEPPVFLLDTGVSPQGQVEAFKHLSVPRQGIYLSPKLFAVFVFPRGLIGKRGMRVRKNGGQAS